MRFLIACALALSCSAPGAAQVGERPTYLPAPRYTAPAEGRAVEAQRTEYYAMDWIVVAPSGEVLCKDPYIRLEAMRIECVSWEPVR